MNFDNTINDHGKQLLDLYKTCDLRILNGRSNGDTLGNFTYHSITGVSTEDYIIVSHNLFASIQGFAVKQPNMFSDHSQIVCWSRLAPFFLETIKIFSIKTKLSFQNSTSGTTRLQQNSLLPFTPMTFCLGYSSLKTQHSI